MWMKRRDWLKSIGCLSSNLALAPFAFSDDRSRKNGTAIPEAELIGKKRPALFGEGFNLRRKAASAFDIMRTAAKKDGIQLYSESSYRDYDRQKRIWNAKVKRYRKAGMPSGKIVREIIRYSTIPGTSRHHWGTDADLIDRAKPTPDDTLLEKHFLPGGVYEPLYRWLKENAGRYGFIEVYTNDPKRTGFDYEPWHWSFAELSIPFLKQFDTIDLSIIRRDDSLLCRDALTDEFLQTYKRKWLFGIDPALIP